MPAWVNKLIVEAHIGLTENNSVSATAARQFLAGRGVSQDDIVIHNIGFAGPSFVVSECAPDFVPWSDQFLRDCIVFPIYSMLEEEIGMQIRLIDTQKHTRPYKQYYAYHRDIHPYFFGLPQALPHVYESGYLVIVEGIFDYFAVRKITPNVVAVLTSGVPVACRRFFKRFTKRVVALLDMDQPGREGAEHLARYAESEGYHVVIPTYSEKDPGELYKKGKMQEIQRIVSSTSKFLLR
jgi:DNA primase